MIISTLPSSTQISPAAEQEEREERERDEMTNSVPHGRTDRHAHIYDASRSRRSFLTPRRPDSICVPLLFTEVEHLQLYFRILSQLSRRFVARFQLFGNF